MAPCACSRFWCFLSRHLTAGPDPVLYLDAESFREQVLQGDRRVAWVVAFYALWSPACVQMAPAFAQLAARYALDNLRFAKLDVTRFPEIAHEHHISTTALSRQLPTVLVFKNGRVAARRPDVEGKKLAPFAFTVENMAAAFDLNNLQQECRQNPIRKKGRRKAELSSFSSEAAVDCPPISEPSVSRVRSRGWWLQGGEDACWRPRLILVNTKGKPSQLVCSNERPLSW
ncbi:hypothetical protein HPB48_027029 [Haemaphysalis longicornis]|uniref:Thioredoxin domain-containing protein n=1 Tax=Haemaphysalis longicornis TaxID=44386 RepID=A0A9J6HDC5_HAELO|nr:hypothetical protein HPB48_027029 [Haemaphysalis longicornis]